MAVAMPTRLATEFTVSVFESIVTFPVTVKEDKLPTLVILGCAAVCSVPVRDVADTVPLAVRLVTFKFPDMSSGPYDTAPEEAFTYMTFPVVAALNPVRLTPPATFREDSVPTAVMFGWAAVRIVPTMLVPDSVVPLTFPAATFAVTVRDPRVPTLVMLVWAAVCRVPVRVDAVTPAVMARDDKVPTLVMLG